MSKNRHSLNSFIIGALLGWIAGIILAPKKRFKVSEKIRRKSENIKDMIEDFTKSLSKKAQNLKSKLETKWISSRNNITNKVDCIEDELGT